MALPDVAKGQPHVAAHNDERHAINRLQPDGNGWYRIPTSWLSGKYEGGIWLQYNDEYNGDPDDPWYPQQGWRIGATDEGGLFIQYYDGTKWHDVVYALSEDDFSFQANIYSYGPASNGGASNTGPLNTSSGGGRILSNGPLAGGGSYFIHGWRNQTLVTLEFYADLSTGSTPQDLSIIQQAVSDTIMPGGEYQGWCPVGESAPYTADVVGDNGQAAHKAMLSAGSGLTFNTGTPNDGGNERWVFTFQARDPLQPIPPEL